MSTERESRSHTSIVVVGVLLTAAAWPVYQFWPRPEPERVTVQHLLISFAGLKTKATRSMAEAEKLAGELFNRADRGEDFDQLVKQFSDDPLPPGIYSLLNTGVKGGPNEYDRKMMVPAFSDLAFKLKVGRIRMAAYHPQNSPYGWHIIKRIQ